MPSLLQAAFVTASPYRWMVKRWRRYGDVFSSPSRSSAASYTWPPPRS
jgi:hypothetical protein